MKSQCSSGEMKPGYVFSIPWELGAIGGVNQVVKNLHDEMKSTESVNPFILINKWELKSYKLTEIDGRDTIHWRQRGFSDEALSLKSLLVYLLCLPYIIIAQMSFAKKFNLACINAHYPGFSVFTWVLMRKLKLFKGHVLVSLHGRDIRDSFSCRGFRKKIWAFVVKNCDYVVTCSDGLRQEVLEHYAVDGKHVVTIHNGINIDVLKNEEKKERGYTLDFIDSPFLLNIGTFEHKKGHDVLLPAFQEVLAKYPDTRLVIVGRKGETSKFIKEKVQEMSLQDNVIIMEDLSHAKTLNLLKRAEFFVLSSRNEAFAIVLLEAGAYQKAVVATKICGVEELIENGQSGLLVPSEDVEQLADAIIKLLNEVSLRDQLADTLHNHVINNFTWEKACDAYLRLVQLSRLSKG